MKDTENRKGINSKALCWSCFISCVLVTQISYKILQNLIT